MSSVSGSTLGPGRTRVPKTNKNWTRVISPTLWLSVTPTRLGDSYGEEGPGVRSPPSWDPFGPGTSETQGTLPVPSSTVKDEGRLVPRGKVTGGQDTPTKDVTTYTPTSLWSCPGPWGSEPIGTTV